MTSIWRAGIAGLMLGIGVGAGTISAYAEIWPGTGASIGGAIAARVIAVKCAGPLTPAEIAELDTYIDHHQAAFMSQSDANRRYGEGVFPRIARDYDFSYANRDACTTEARSMVTDMLARVRAAEAHDKQAHLKQ